ncbi:MAG TPA: hypothetical protein VII78_02850 [Myxococcota bacterium]|jgi:hypothetical protein
MTRTARLPLASMLPLLGLLLAASCASPRPPAEYVPPRLDLERYGALGIVEFAGSGASGLGADATREFVAAVHAAQPGTPMLELGDFAAAFPGAKSAKLAPAAVREIAAREKVEAVWVGEVSEHEGKARFALDPNYGTASASAQRVANISVRLLDGVSGATVWSASSERTIPVVAVNGSLAGLPNVRTTPAEEARAILLRDLVNDVTYDLRPQWVQR